MASSLAQLVRTFPRSRVAVLGDLMLDRYIWGQATRISQEAPVPVVRVQRESRVPGGAANVVRNILSLGGAASVFGAVGPDTHGENLVALLRDGGADTHGILTAHDRPTTIKTRVVAGNQQVCRVDREETGSLPAPLRTRIEDALFSALEQDGIDGVILEDYAKGLLQAESLQAVVDRARELNLPVALDPHPSHPFNLRGLDLLTPNRAEAFGLAGVYYRPGVLPLEEDSALLEVGKRLRHEWQVRVLLITLGPGGMALFASDDGPVHIQTKAREVFDVSGAGDTVMASFVLALLADATPEQAAHIANHAAGIVVGKVGTVAATAADLLADLGADHDA